MDFDSSVPCPIDIPCACPSPDCTNMRPKGTQVKLSDIIIILNDTQCWTFDQIADWIDTLDEQPVFYPLSDDNPAIPIGPSPKVTVGGKSYGKSYYASHTSQGMFQQKDPKWVEETLEKNDWVVEKAESLANWHASIEAAGAVPLDEYEGWIKPTVDIAGDIKAAKELMMKESNHVSTHHSTPYYAPGSPYYDCYSVYDSG